MVLRKAALLGWCLACCAGGAWCETPAAQPAPAAAPASEAKPAPIEPLICKAVEVTGSRVARRKVCMTKGAWAQASGAPATVVGRAALMGAQHTGGNDPGN
jgi:hypothetical protein